MGDPVRSCRRCHRPGPPVDSPASLAWQPVVEDGRIVAMICPDCLTLKEQRAIRAEQVSLVRRLKRGLPPDH